MTEKKEPKVEEDVKKVQEPEVEAKEAEGSEDDKLAAAQKLVRKYMWWSVGAGVIPLPLIDLGAVAAAQLRMLHQMSKHYGVEFKENQVKSIIAALAGTITAQALRGSVLTSFIKSIPLVGIVGSFPLPLYAGALTYAIGKVFIQHFESGGTFLDFDPKKVREQFGKLYEQGKEKVSKLKTKKAEEEPQAA